MVGVGLGRTEQRPAPADAGARRFKPGEEIAFSTKWGILAITTGDFR